MPLTQAHDERRTLTPEQVAARMLRPLKEIMHLGTIERAEVLEGLREVGARVRVSADQDEDIPFEMATSHMRSVPPSKYVIPGRKKPAAFLPLNAAIYVASHLDFPQFGGGHQKSGKRQPDGMVPIEPVEARPDLITLELVLDTDS